MQAEFVKLLMGKDLRALRRVGEAMRLVHDQKSFDELFALLFHHERPLSMRAADAVEKISLRQPHFLAPHKAQLLALMRGAAPIELKWHVAQLVVRLELSPPELNEVWSVLSYWAHNPNESRIVRVNALQGMFDLLKVFPKRMEDFRSTLESLRHERIPSLSARLRKLERLLKTLDP